MPNNSAGSQKFITEFYSNKEISNEKWKNAVAEIPCDKLASSKLLTLEYLVPEYPTIFGIGGFRHWIAFIFYAINYADYEHNYTWRHVNEWKQLSGW